MQGYKIERIALGASADATTLTKYVNSLPPAMIESILNTYNAIKGELIFIDDY